MDLLDVKPWRPLSYFNINNDFFSINSETVINTWVALGILLIVCIICRWFLHRKQSTVRYLTLSFVRSFTDLTTQAVGYFSFKYIAFITTLFTFIMLCNTVALIPWISEPTKDLNTALSMGILSFLYIQWQAVKSHGLIPYVKEFFSPIFVMFPLHVIGKLSSVVSISFRLFGNIFGSATITHIYLQIISTSFFAEMAGILSGVNIIMVLFFVLFEGLLQAFVFTMLSLTYLALAIAPEEEHT